MKIRIIKRLQTSDCVYHQDSVVEYSEVVSLDEIKSGLIEELAKGDDPTYVSIINLEGEIISIPFKLVKSLTLDISEVE